MARGGVPFKTFECGFDLFRSVRGIDLAAHYSYKFFKLGVLSHTSIGAHEEYVNIIKPQTTVKPTSPKR